MKKILLLAFSLFIFQSITSQEKNGVAFINADFNLTFRVNENFEFGNDNDESFFIPSEVLLRFGFGYEYKKRIAVILQNIARKSKHKKIDPKITKRIWKSMIRAFIDYEFRNFKKK